MKDAVTPESRLKNLSSFKRAAASMSRHTLVKESGEGLPLVVEPNIKGVNLIAWASENQEFIGERLLKFGGVLFRGFKLNDADEFEQFMKASSGELLEYTYASTPRSQVSGRVYTSTEYPANQSIPLHNEMSYARVWPKRVGFFCQRPAEQGGQTPLADSRKVFELIDPAIKAKFIEKNVMYVRNYGEGLDLTWQKAFGTTSRDEAARFCEHAGIEFMWKDDDRLRTRQICQSVVRHPQTGAEVWFNQGHLFHISSLEPAFRDALLAKLKEEDLPRNAYYGDGSPIEPNDLAQIRNAYRDASITFEWRERDVLLLDNVLTAHGRAPYTGSRSILVGMA